eukprot:tig00000944_g5956.t1
MGKNQHSKDKMWITSTEWKEEWGGKKAAAASGVRRLPYSACSLSFQNWEDPVCDAEGHIFEILSIVPWLKKYGKNPCTGQPMSAKELVKLNFHKNGNGEFHCPVTFKVFNEFTKIVAVRQTGNVYSWDAIEELCIKPKHWKDLLTDEPFTRRDLVVLQDPMKTDGLTADKFYHVVSNTTRIDDGALETVNANDATKRIFQKLAEREEARVEAQKRKAEADAAEVEAAKAAPGVEESGGTPAGDASAASKKLKTDSDKAAAASTSTSSKKPEVLNISTGRMAASFTSTAMSIITKQEHAVKADEGRVPKKKGYVQLTTSHGDINLELHCDLAPRTCENFIRLCERGYYDGVAFHRLIKNFMIQGGDPTGTGRGGESIYGKKFKDEIRQSLSHDGRGILSMANSGANTNGSQFFITFKSCTHLDLKHTIFGRVVGGLPTLAAMEKVETNKDDRPKEPIKIIKTAVFVNPYDEPDEQVEALKEAEKKRTQADREMAAYADFLFGPTEKKASGAKAGLPSAPSESKGGMFSARVQGGGLKLRSSTGQTSQDFCSG